MKIDIYKEDAERLEAIADQNSITTKEVVGLLMEYADEMMERFCMRGEKDED